MRTDGWQFAIYQGFGIVFAHFDKTLDAQSSPFNLLRSHCFADVSLERMDQFHKFGSEFALWQRVEVMQIFLLFCGSHQSEALTIFEEGFDLHTYLIFTVSSLGIFGLML